MFASAVMDTTALQDYQFLLMNPTNKPREHYLGNFYM